MIPIIIAIFLAFSAVGGGVVYVAHDAPPSSPLHRIAATTDAVFFTAQVPVTHPTASPEADDPPTASPTAKPTDADAESTPERRPHATLTPLPTGIATAIATLEADVGNLLKTPETHGEAARGLQAKLDAATGAVARGNGHAAVNVLNAFAHELNAMERSGRISQSDYDSLYGQYASLLQQLNATPVATVTPHPTERPHEPATPSGTPEAREHKAKAEVTEAKAEPTEAPEATEAPRANRTAEPRETEHRKGDNSVDHSDSKDGSSASTHRDAPDKGDAGDHAESKSKANHR